MRVITDFHLHLIELVTYCFVKMLIPFVMGMCFYFCRRNMLTEELPTTDALDSLPFENYEGYDLVSAKLYQNCICAQSVDL